MRISYTSGQVAMLIGRAERQLEQVVADSIQQDGGSRNIARSAHHTLHETVVTLMRVFREQVPGGAAAATRIAREYAKGADARSGAPTMASVRTILSVVQEARTSYLAEATGVAGVEAAPPVDTAPTRDIRTG